MVADHVEFLRHSRVAVLAGGFAAELSADRVCLDRVATLGASFSCDHLLQPTLSRPTLNNIVLPSGSAARSVMSVMVHRLTAAKQPH